MAGDRLRVAAAGDMKIFSLQRYTQFLPDYFSRVLDVILSSLLLCYFPLYSLLLSTEFAGPNPIVFSADYDHGDDCNDFDDDDNDDYKGCGVGGGHQVVVPEAGCLPPLRFQ